MKKLTPMKDLTKLILAVLITAVLVYVAIDDINNRHDQKMKYYEQQMNHFDSVAYKLQEIRKHP